MVGRGGGTPTTGRGNDMIGREGGGGGGGGGHTRSSNYGNGVGMGLGCKTGEDDGDGKEYKHKNHRKQARSSENENGKEVKEQRDDSGLTEENEVPIMWAYSGLGTLSRITNCMDFLISRVTPTKNNPPFLLH